MKYQLPLVFAVLVCLPVSSLAQSSVFSKVMPIGQLDAPTVRQMRAVSCGPFFTMTPTDAGGGGMVNLAIESATAEVAIITLPVKAIHVKWCDTCETPQFAASGNESTVRGDLTISREQWKLSPCLKLAKVSGR